MCKNLIRKIRMECPICDKIHDIEERTRLSTTIIKGEKVVYNERYYHCANAGDGECDFVPGVVLNSNLLLARNEYRRMHKLLTSQEIVQIREMYGLSQVDLARLLGWGEATVSRYESKAIQDDTYDNTLRMIKCNPIMLIDFLEKNHDKFTEDKIKEIRSRVIENIEIRGKEYLQRQALESKYASFYEPCDANGNKVLDIDKIEATISYLATFVKNLYKVKLIKMLWYTDALRYKTYGQSMTGLVYCHEKMGALPIGHYEIVGLEGVNMVEEDNFENTSFHFYPNNSISFKVFSDEDRAVLDAVVNKFKDYSSRGIVDYMHEETAYTKTKDGDIIPYSLSAEIRPF